MAVGIGWTASAAALDGGWFETLDRFERITDEADESAGDTRRRADALEEHLETTLTDADTARRATEELRSDVAAKVARWDAASRRADRLRWTSDGADGRAMRRALEVAEVPATKEWRHQVELLSDVAAGVEHAGALLVRRGELEVEFAQNRAVAQSASASRDHTVERAANSDTDDEIADEVREIAEQLAAQIDLLTPLPARDDFHRNKGALFPPVSASPTHLFGPRRREDSFTEIRHTGLTYEVGEGTEVRSIARGTVVKAERMMGYGNVLIVDHGGQYHSIYAHLSAFAVDEGDEVDERQKIGESGDSGSLEGPKFYFELRQRGTPVDPQEWFVSQ